MVDETKLNAFIGKMLGDLGGAFSVPMVRMGEKLGLFEALKERADDAEELAAKTKVAERYAREWLSPGVVRLSRIMTPPWTSSPCRRNRRWCLRR